MPRGKAKSRFDKEKDQCEFEKSSWCELPKWKRCSYCLRLADGRKACGWIAETWDMRIDMNKELQESADPCA